MPADPTNQVPVVIAGAGPAGLVAAVTLARNGVRSLLVERNQGLSPLPRATAVSTRTMELLRSWGLEDEVRAGQLDLNSTGAWAAETLASPEGAELPLGVAGIEQAAAASPTTLAAVPQDHLEPVLLGHLRGARADRDPVRHRADRPRPGRRRRHRHAAAAGRRSGAGRPGRLPGRRRRRPLGGAAPARHRHGRPRPPERAAHGAVRGAAGRGRWRPPPRHLLHPASRGRRRAGPQRGRRPLVVRAGLGPAPRTAGGLHRRPPHRPDPHRGRRRRPPGPGRGQGRVLVRRPGRRALPGGSRLPGRRRRPAHDPSRRHGHEHRRGRGPRPRLEAGLGPQRLGRPRPPWQLRGRVAPRRGPPHRPLSPGGRRAGRRRSPRRGPQRPPSPRLAPLGRRPSPLHPRPPRPRPHPPHRPRSRRRRLDRRRGRPRHPVPADRPHPRPRDRHRPGRHPDGAILARPDAQVVAHWPSAPADPAAALSTLASAWSATLMGRLRVSAGAG